MRENIGLYKAKRKDTGDWVEGGFLNGIKPRIIINGEYIKGLFVIDSFEIDSKTLCECTGLKDKNGKLIFENDVVKDDLGLCLTVCFGCFSIGIDDWGIEHITQGFSLKFSDESGYCGLNNNKELEVIGNKFDSEVE